ncbi:MAG: transporter substrate-binding domain-containing protein [Burkholderiales bacterium]|nr:transporter substrate-binding domain-containing protein [Burkholderiales bacterium]
MHDYPPLAAEKLPYGGLLSRIVTEAFEMEDVDVKIIYVANNRAITGVMKGLYDGSFGWSHAPDRDQQLLFSNKPIYNFRMVLFHRKEQDYVWKTLADLHGYRFGLTLGNHYSDELTSLQSSGRLNVDFANSDLSNMRKLLAGHIDLFPMEEEAGQWLLNSSFTAPERAKITSDENAMWAIPTYFVLRKSLPHAQDLMARFDRGYQQLITSGRLPKLIEETKKVLYEAPLTPAVD